ncbi:Hypothetical protein RG1141_CH44090 [Neorhizobium galegae bv. officinalis bv. officinalis str. HAMBI 1141]|uniref:Uncharacterized protein n=3 Tax=Rhizobium/Agrobacterium group TaxID=227290 RepID=A0A068TF76_NEOGA|nr:Hypothetical protein RG1141_CH44090 [Neorhizobium galegae bv. officinalis bv. officinalis str. HAMBI 1141]
MSVLGEIGVAFDAVSGDGIIRKPTGETAEFEGEVVALTCPVSGYHVRLVWKGELPRALAPYLVNRGASGKDQTH